MHSPQRPDEGEQGRFAGAGRTCHDHDLASADLQVVVEEHLGSRLACTVGVVDPLARITTSARAGCMTATEVIVENVPVSAHGGAHESLHSGKELRGIDREQLPGGVSRRQHAHDHRQTQDR